WESWYYRALILVELKEWDSAAAALTRAIQLDDSSEQLYVKRAEIYKKLGDLEKALSDVTKLTELRPQSWRYRNDRRQLHARQGQAEKAAADLAIAVKLVADHPAEMDELAWSLVSVADPQASDPTIAIQLAERAVATAPENGRFWRTLGAARYRA